MLIFRHPENMILAFQYRLCKPVSAHKNPTGIQMKNIIETDQTLMQIYPHTGTAFHHFMCILMALHIPLGIIMFPFLVISKLLLYSAFYVITRPIINTRTYKILWAVKNCLLLPFHHYIYATSYIYITIWLNAFLAYDDYWFGVDKSKHTDYEDFRSSYRRAVTRRKFRLKLAAYDSAGITEEELQSPVSFFKLLFSYSIFQLIKESSIRKNGDNPFLFAVILIIREYHLLLLLPVHLRLYKDQGKVVGLSSSLIRGNTFLVCQCIIASGSTRTGIFYKMMKDRMEKAFTMENIRYISSGPTANQSKETSGYYAINYLLTDEFRFMPFSLM